MKRPILRSGLLGSTLLCGLPAVLAQPTEKHAIKFDDLIHMHRVAEAQVSPDGKWVAYSVATPDLEANRSVRNIWIVATAGSEAREVTHLSTSADLLKWSPDGKTIAFTSSVYPDCKDDACNSTRDAEKEKNRIKARVYEQLLYRHWTHWFEGKRSHVFVITADGSGEPRDLNAGANYDVPPD